MLTQQLLIRPVSISGSSVRDRTLNIGDAIIAATASEMELSLVTRNLKHYSMKDISLLKPY